MSTKNKKKSLGKVGTVIVYILLSVAVVVALFPLAWVAHPLNQEMKFFQILHIGFQRHLH